MENDRVVLGDAVMEPIVEAPTYWANYPVEKLLPEVDDRVQKYYDFLNDSGRLQLWRKMHEQMYRGLSTGGHLGAAGEQGELTTIDVNEMRNLYEHTLNLITGQRLEFEAMAANSDHDSQSQTITADAVIDYANRSLGMEKRMIQAVSGMIEYGEAGVWFDWDTDAGPDYRPDETGKIQKAGDVKFRMLHPLDLIRDVELSEFDDSVWAAARIWRNRHDLAAKYHEIADEIAECHGRGESEDSTRPRLADSSWRNRSSASDGKSESDEVPVYYWYHKRTPALPEGRMILYLEPDILLFDGPLPFKEFPIERVVAAEIDDEPFGYSSFFDLLALQTAIDSTVSTVVSNQAAFGVQNIWTPEGVNLEIKQLANGLNWMSGGTQPPQPLQLLATAPETFKLFDLIRAAVERLSGVNSTVRGNPEASLKSGAALALVYSQTVQFIGLAQRAFHTAAERIATKVIQAYQDLSDVERTIAIAGEQSRTYAVTLRKGGLKAIERVSIRVANPMAGTIAGRYNLAEMMLQNGMIKEPEQLMMVLKTGQLDNVTESPVRERMNIRAENERLSRGEVPTAVFLDHPLRHIAEHATVLASPEAREAPKIVAACRAHIQQHLELWKTTDPDILVSLGIPPPPSMQMQGPPPGPPPGEGPPPGPGEEPGAPPMPTPDVTSPVLQDSGVNMPRAPTNPATGEAVALPGVNM
jgi:hypothetical protein